MKNTKKILFVAILSIGMTSSVFASWWNPVSWKFFSKQDKQTVQEKVVVISTSTQNQKEVTPLVEAVTQQTYEKSTKKLNIKDLPKNSYVVVKPKQTETKKDTVAVKETPQISEKQKLTQEVLDYKKTLGEQYLEHINDLDKTRKITELMRGAVKNKISTTEDMFIESEGYKMANPDSSGAVDYINGLYKIQLNFNKKYLEYYDKAILWLEDSLKAQKENLAKLDGLTTMEDLKVFSVALNSSEVELKKVKQTSDEWSESSRKDQLKFDGIMAGLSSRYSGSNSSNGNQVMVAPSQPTYTPPSSIYKVNCTSRKTFIGDVETKCY